MRCVYCGKLGAIKYGKRKILSVSFSRRSVKELQRYQCRACRRTFSRRREKRKRYTMGFKREVVRMHVEERMSYRVISKRVRERYGKRVSPRQLCRMVAEVAQTSKSSVEVKLEYKPRWEGYLTVDDKNVRVKGKKYPSLVAVDRSGDPLHSEVFEQLNQENVDDFFCYLKDRLRYPFKGITTDLDPMLEKAIRGVISAAIPHQKCLWHAAEAVKETIGWLATVRASKRLTKKVAELEESLDSRKQSLYNARKRLVQLQTELAEVTRAYEAKHKLLERFNPAFSGIWAKKRSRSEQLWKAFRRDYSSTYPAVVKFLATHWEGLLTHQRHPGVKTTNVMAENINKQFQRRFKTIEAFQSVDSAFDYLNLYRNYLRFKLYTDCRGDRKHRNGRSPLQLCGATIPTTDWLANAIRSPSITNR